MIRSMDPARERLALLVARRRKQRQLSASEAARLAKVSRGTWIAVEKAERETEDYNYAGFERALQWQFGSIETVLAGGEPTPSGPPPGSEVQPPEQAQIARKINAALADENLPLRLRERLRDRLQVVYDDWRELVRATGITGRLDQDDTEPDSREEERVRR